MSQPCLYNFYQKATTFLQQPVTTEGIHSAICYSTQSSDSRQLVDGVQLQTCYISLPASLHTECFIYLLTSLQHHTKAKKIPVGHNLFAKLLCIRFASIM